MRPPSVSILSAASAAGSDVLDHLRGAGPLLVALLVLVLGAGCDELVQQTGPQGEVISQEISAEAADEAREFWTQERMASATPISRGSAVDSLPDLGQANTPSDTATVRTSGGVSPEYPGYEADQSTAGKSGRAAVPADGSFEQASQVSATYTQYPHRTIGKVFFEKDDGRTFTCSAAVIETENKSVVWTAGHCVAEQGDENWHENWIFVPAFQNGNAPLGRWSARQLVTWSGWYSGGNRNYDLAAVVLEQRDDRRIGLVTGTLGWAFNQPREQDFQTFGYPGAGNLVNGQTMWTCSLPYNGADGVQNQAGPRTNGIQCDYTAGASGGPWVTNFDDCPSCYINSANSWWWWNRGHSHEGVRWAGPYHGNAAYKILEYAGQQ